MRFASPIALASVFFMLACSAVEEHGAGERPGSPAHLRRITAAVDDARLAAAAQEPGNWLTHGRTYDEQRFSPLAQIDAGNVVELGLAWSFDLQTERGVESTPLAVDGILYVTAPWSVVVAIDARSGAQLWRWDPQVPRHYARRACCDVVNRGPALYRGKLYVGVLDGRLAALDAATGRLVWEVATVDPDKPYTITGAPRVVQGKVIIGNGGAEFGVRGYVSAYDAQTGELAWRTYTVPGDPSQPFESSALEAAAQTWNGEWWRYGGGGTAWDAIVYDPELDLLYVGTGNGAPWSRWARSPGGGDNLFLSSILALRPSDGELVWHFQTTPGDTWDYTSTQPMILSDLRIEGRLRKVLLQAPKNGFFWVIDRETGEYISAEPYVHVSWALGVDASGRPIERPDTDYRRGVSVVSPSNFGGHNWNPMSFHPGTGLVYFPAHETAIPLKVDSDWHFVAGDWNTGYDFTDLPPGVWERVGDVSGHLVAWDPVAQREVWRVPHRTAGNGGTLSTAGNLVFHGSADGRFAAYRATDGALLWESPAGTAVMAGPITYLVDGVQHVTVAAGWGGGFAGGGGEPALRAGVRGGGRVLTFALGASAEVPPGRPPRSEPPPRPTFELPASDEELARGGDLYALRCGPCHGFAAVSGGSFADLRYSSGEVHASFEGIVLGGGFESRGMPGFADVLTAADVRSIQAYILSRAAADSGAP